MITYLVALLCLVSGALAAGSILLSLQLRKKWNQEYFTSLLYYEVFLFLFGFYALWGQVATRYLLGPHISADLMNRVLDLTILLGMPFVIFAWYMLLRFIYELNGKRLSILITIMYILINLAILLLISILPAHKAQYNIFELVKMYYCIFSCIYTVLAIILLFSSPQSVPGLFHRRILALILAGFALAQCILLVCYSGALWQSLLFILLYFAGSAPVPAYLHYLADLSPQGMPSLPKPSFEDFCRRFEISPRERDIIREICNGHTNQEIADKLFISLQTVKDHTHRIYSKVDIKSRVQLIRLVGDTE